MLKVDMFYLEAFLTLYIKNNKNDVGIFNNSAFLYIIIKLYITDYSASCLTQTSLTQIHG